MFTRTRKYLERSLGADEGRNVGEGEWAGCWPGNATLGGD